MNELIRSGAGRRLAELAPGWADGHGEGISAVALALMDEFYAQLSPELAGRFPAFGVEDGGILVESSTTSFVLSVEFQPDGNIYGFFLAPGSNDGIHEPNLSLSEAVEFTRKHYPLAS